jgi:hypothetical protein
LFDPGFYVQVGATWPYQGELWAEGKSDSIISFKPYNNTAGGWGGIFFDEYNDNYGGVSPFKYCNIEKGDDYNLYCNYSAQPTLDHCNLTQSTGHGLKLVSSNPVIRSSTFSNNAANGINIEGGTSLTLGNTDTTSCNIFNNKGYDLYNNGTAEINARYNYWATGDSTMTGFRIYDKSDNSAKGRVNFCPFAQVPSLMTTNTVMTGTVKFGNSVSSPVKNATMAIKTFGNAAVASTTTNTSGVFTFPSFASGNYKMTITPVAPTPPWAGCNSTDALAIQNHFAQILPLTGINLAAADVNYSHSVNGTDVLLVMKRYTFLISTFPAGDYLYDSDTVIVSGSNVTNTIRMVCFGDVNGHYVPAAKSSASVGLVHEGTLQAESFAEFDFPVKLKTGMQVGAISLGFYFPEEFLEITGAELANGVNNFSWTASDGLFLMGWCDPNALNINNDEVVVILKMKAKDLSGLTSGIALDLYEDCEFADALATPNDGAIVSIPMINSPLTGIRPANNTTGLTVYPNPVSGNSTISFSLDKPGTIRMVLVDMVGNQVMEVLSGDFSAGNHKTTLSASSLKSGIYFLKLTNTDNGPSFSDMIKVVVSY